MKIREPPGVPITMATRPPLGQDRRRHRGQRALARGDGVRVGADHAELVRHAGLGGEVVHLVVQQEARLLDRPRRRRSSRSGCRCWRRRRPAVDDRKVGRLRLLQPGLDRARRRRPCPDRSRPRGGRRRPDRSAPRPGPSRSPGRRDSRRGRRTRASRSPRSGACTAASSAPRPAKRRAASCFMRQQLQQGDAARARRRRGDHLEARASPPRSARATPLCSRRGLPW